MHNLKYARLLLGMVSAVALGLASCGSGDQQVRTADAAADSLPVQRVDTDQSPRLGWTDSLVLRYIRSTESFKDPELRDSLTYFFDRREISDTAHYLIYQIGHSFEGNFMTDRWLYLDSTRRTALEYDVVNDSLMHWPR